jgi:hypothetical protein
MAVAEDMLYGPLQTGAVKTTTRLPGGSSVAKTALPRQPRSALAALLDIAFQHEG